MNDISKLIGDAVGEALRAQAAEGDRELAVLVQSWEARAGRSVFMLSHGGTTVWSPGDEWLLVDIVYESSRPPVRVGVDVGGRLATTRLWARPYRWWARADRRQRRLMLSAIEGYS